jgi:hypothetical protein
MVSAPVIFLDCLSYHAHRGKKSFDIHVWMVKTLLGQPEVDVSSKRSDFLLYVIAVSFQKMNHLLTDVRVSQHYFDCLTKMTTFAFNGSTVMKAGDRDRDIVDWESSFSPIFCV